MRYQTSPKQSDNASLKPQNTSYDSAFKRLTFRRKPLAPKTKKSLLKRPIVFAILLTIWVVAVVICSQLIIGYPMLLLLGQHTFTLPVWTAIYSTLSYALALSLTIFVPYKLSKKLKTSREELGLLGAPTWTDIGLAPIGYIVSIILAAILTAIFSLLPWFNPTESQNVGFSTFLSDPDRLIAFFTLAILAPIFEEIIFRGWLYGKLRARLSMPIAIILTSLAFAIVHLQWNVGVNVFAVSIVLCALREVTGTIYSGILLHILKNGLAFYLLYILGIS